MKSSRLRYEEFRRRLRQARNRALYNVARTQDEIAAREPHQAGSVWEETTTQATTETLSQLEGRERHELDEIAAAEARLATGAYGACETCGRPISLARLRALPAARRCRACEAATEPRPPAARAIRNTLRRLTPIAGDMRPTPVAGGRSAPVMTAAMTRDATTAPARVRRRRRRATAAVSKGTTLFQTDRGPRAAWPASSSKRKKR